MTPDKQLPLLQRAANTIDALLSVAPISLTTHQVLAATKIAADLRAEHPKEVVTDEKFDAKALRIWNECAGVDELVTPAFIMEFSRRLRAAITKDAAAEKPCGRIDDRGNYSGSTSDAPFDVYLRPARAALAEQDAEPIGWICDDDMAILQRDGECTIYQERQDVVFTNEQPQMPLYTRPSPAAQDAAAGEPVAVIEPANEIIPYPHIKRLVDISEIPVGTNLFTRPAPVAAVPPASEHMVMVPKDLLEAFATDEGPEQHELNKLRDLLAAAKVTP